MFKSVKDHLVFSFSALTTSIARPFQTKETKLKWNQRHGLTWPCLFKETSDTNPFIFNALLYSHIR